MRRRRIPRETAERFEALRRHTSLLRDFYARAFAEGDDRYLGEVAGKLRVLVYESRTNHPLLLDIAEQFGIDTSFTISGPPQFEIAPGVHGGDQVDLREWLNYLAFFTTTETGEQLQLSNIEVITLWAQQTGASHEDPELDERLHRLRNSGVYIGGRASDAAVLQSIAATVLSVAERVLDAITQRDASS